MYRHETNKINLITERRNSSTSLIVPSPLLLEGKKYTILSKLLYTIFIFTRHVRKGKRVYIYIYNIRERERNMYGRENSVPKGRNSQTIFPYFVATSFITYYVLSFFHFPLPRPSPVYYYFPSTLHICSISSPPMFSLYTFARLQNRDKNDHTRVGNGKLSATYDCIYIYIYTSGALILRARETCVHRKSLDVSTFRYVTRCGFSDSGREGGENESRNILFFNGTWRC